MNLFILTGLAIVVYLNQSDPQPRERDYAYVGSFFAFSIWIGIGVFGILSELNRRFNIKSLVPSILLLCIMPILMGITDWREHDRSQRYEAWDYAYNLLNSCEPNAILFTNGDNDTFPLWYIQEVENIRKDVKVVNLSLLNFPSYIRQLDEHKPSLKMFNLDSEIDEYLEIVESENYDLLMEYAFSRYLQNDYTIDLKSDSGKNFTWKFNPGTYGVGLTNITILKIIEECFDLNPIYFSTTTGNNNLGLDDYLIQEGLVYKLSNQKNNTPMDIRMDIEKTIQMITKSNDNNLLRNADDFNNARLISEGIYRYQNLDKEGVFYGPNIERLAANYRNVFFKTATNIALDLNRSNHLNESFKIINLMNEYFPRHIIPTEISYDYGALSFCQSLLQVIQYKIEQNPNDFNLDENMKLIDSNIQNLLSTVDPKLVKKYFPDFYIQ